MHKKRITKLQIIAIAVAILMVVGGCVAYWYQQENRRITAATAAAEEAAALRAARQLAAQRLKEVTVKAKRPIRTFERPTPPPPEPRPLVLEWQAFNPDTVAYLKIDDTKVDYPVVQGTDNDYYLNHTIDHIRATRGSIFLDMHVKFDPLELPRHLLIHGHHMRDGSMFQNVTLYKERDFFYSNPVIRFETLYLETLWEVFAVYICDSSEYVPVVFRDDDAYVSYLQTTQERSMYPVEMGFTAEDTIMTLNTCSYEFQGAHTLVVAKLAETRWTY